MAILKHYQSHVTENFIQLTINTLETMTQLWSNKCYAEATLELPNFKLTDVQCSSNDDFIKMMTEELSQIEAKDIYDFFTE